MRVALLDVNVLIALIDPNHVFHDAAHEWFDQNRQYGWATCPITENACLRILGKPGYPYRGLTIAGVRGILARFCATREHRFWPDSVSVLDETRFGLTSAGPKNITDLYLLGMAIAQGGRLVTFDRGIREELIAGAEPGSIQIIV